MDSKKVLFIVLLTGLVLLAISCICIAILTLPTFFAKKVDSDARNYIEESEINKIEGEIIKDEATCDDTNSEYFSFHGVEQVLVSKNPCRVMWLLAKEEESYQMETKAGRIIYITIWRDFEDNVTPGNTFTIRALDVTDTTPERDTATISITRWVANESELTQAKLEVQDAISTL